jgi:hypothetical protein
MQLFAFQNAQHPFADLPIWVFVIGSAAIALLLFAVFFFWLIFRQVARSREMSHLERMKALELGQATDPLGADERQNKYAHNAFWISFWIGAGVPMAATSAVSSVMVQSSLRDFGVILAVWICVAIISVASVVCATVLMISSRHWAKKGDRNDSGHGSVV